MSKSSTYIKYNTLKETAQKIKKIKSKLSDYKIKIPSTSTEEIKISTFSEAKSYCKTLSIYDFKIHPDIRNAVGDTDYYFPLKWGNRQQITKKSSEAIPGQKIDGADRYDSDLGGLLASNYFGANIRYNLPSIEEAIKGLSNRGCSIWEPLDRDKNKVEDLRSYLKKGKTMCKQLLKAIKQYNKDVDKIIAGLDAEYGNIMKIYNAYKDLEKSAAGAKNAKRYLSKILKDAKKKTNSKITSSDVISVYKEWKNNGKKISGNLYSTKSKSSSSGGSSKTSSSVAATTGAVVASATKSSSGTKSKSKKKSTTKNVLVGASVLAATKTGLKADIKQVKADAATQISNAKIVAGDQKRKLEIEKNEKIAEINKKATDKINEIDPNEENAQEKIDAIKKEAEEDVAAVNEQYNNDIAKIDEDLKTEIANIESNRDNTVKDLNNQLDQLKSDKTSNTVVENKLTSVTKMGTTAAVASTSQSDVTASNEEMMNATGELSDVYEEKSYSIQQAIENADSTITVDTQTTADTTTVNTTDNATAAVTVEEESVASPTTTETTSEDTGSITTYTSSSTNNTNDNYVTDDSPRADIATTESTTIEATKDTGVDQSNAAENIDDSLKGSSTTDIETEDDVVSIAGSDKTEDSKKSSGLGAAIPIGLGVAAAGAAAVAGVRYVKNRKQNEDMDENYDDENNNLDSYEDIPSDSAYMRDDYLGPAGSAYTEVPDENSYTDAEELEEAAGVNEFSEDTALNDLN